MRRDRQLILAPLALHHVDVGHEVLAAHIRFGRRATEVVGVEDAVDRIQILAREVLAGRLLAQTPRQALQFRDRVGRFAALDVERVVDQLLAFRFERRVSITSRERSRRLLGVATLSCKVRCTTGGGAGVSSGDQVAGDGGRLLARRHNVLTVGDAVDGAQLRDDHLTTLVAVQSVDRLLLDAAVLQRVGETLVDLGIDAGFDLIRRFRCGDQIFQHVSARRVAKPFSHLIRLQ